MAVKAENQWVRVSSLLELKRQNCLTAQANGHTLALFHHGGRVFAVDNRCPHMGFPLSDGSVRDGILTCHWHHARFDLASGGTFDPWADDVPAFPIELRGEEIWVNVAPPFEPINKQRVRLQEGLERNLSLVLAKAAITLLKGGIEPREPFVAGLSFGVRFRRSGWGQGLTILTCMMNLLPQLAIEQRARALYHGLSAVASDNAMASPRHLLKPLPASIKDIPQLTGWFRQFIEVRDAEGAERVILSAYQEGAARAEIAEMLFAAATDHRYINGGHTLDFINKALEALDITEWRDAEPVLSSLTPILADARRMEENNAWRHPVDLVELAENAFLELPAALAAGNEKQPSREVAISLEETLLQGSPADISRALLHALREGLSPIALASEVTFAAATRIARFHTSNEFGDWDTALHTFTFANAVHQGLIRYPSPSLLRGVWDAALSVYLDRFLNIPAARLPSAEPNGVAPETLLRELSSLLNQQRQVNEAGSLVQQFLSNGGDATALIASMGELLLREDRDFHTIQCLEAAVQQYALQASRQRGERILVAAARYLAAHAPTMRAQGQTYQIALRLTRGDELFQEE